MNIIILTQEEIFYLPDNLPYLLNELQRHNINVTGTVILEQSPFGKKIKFSDKVAETISVFGYKFFIYYTLKFIYRKLSGKTVKNVFSSRKINIITLNNPINHKDSLAVFRDYKPDVIVSVAGNQIFKKELLSIPAKGCINLHTALLPKYRGLMPVFWAMKNKEEKIGVSVFMMDEGIDSGPILIQKEFMDSGKHSMEEIIKKTKKIGMDSIVEALLKLKNNNYEAYENREDMSTYYGFPTKKDVLEFCAARRRFF